MDLARIAASDGPALLWLRSTNRVGTDWANQLAASSPFRRAFEAFLARYGHRGVYESYLGNPRWREAPDYLLDSIVGLIGHDPARIRERQRQSYLEARRQVAQALPFWYRLVIPSLIKFATVERNMRERARERPRRSRRGGTPAHARTGRAARRAPGIWRRRMTSSTSPWLKFMRWPRASLLLQPRWSRAAWRRRQLDEFAARAEPEVVIEHGRTATQSAPASAEPQSERG